MEQIATIIYDFDKTLSPRDMQEYGYLSGLNMAPEEFWSKCDAFRDENNTDMILGYMYIMLDQAKGKMLLNREEFNKQGRTVELFDGVKTWFERINAYGRSLGIPIEHYIISSGLKEIIEGTEIAGEFEEIFAAEFVYNRHGEPIWPAQAVNYTSKTQFLFRINKGMLDPTDNEHINEYLPEEKRRIPFRNMIYIGDGMTDVPCMKLVKVNGGHSIAVFQDNDDTAKKLLEQGRIDFARKADYSENSELEIAVKTIINKIHAVNKTLELRSGNIK